MFSTALVAVGAFGLLFAAMAVGLLRGKALKGSCGGVAGSACLCSDGQQQACELKQKIKEAAERAAAERAATGAAGADSSSAGTAS
ncbi:MAG: hypothetical protein H6747_04530 [Deltaproteobacteria bacterium]|nr:hypothetical protein [Deltaproteobacteria bacterium]